MMEKFDTTRLRRGIYLFVLGIGVTSTGLMAGTEFATGVRLMLLGPLLALGGIGFIGAAAVPVFVTYVGGEDATWDDLSLLWQLIISFVIALGLFISYLVIWSLRP